MSHLFRLRARGQTRRRRDLRFDAVLLLEERCLLAPFVALGPDVVTFTPATVPTNTNLGTVTVTPATGAAGAAGAAGGNLSAAPTTSVAMLTSNGSFGGDVVLIKAGPGGDFGEGVYAISRGAGPDPTGTFVNGVIPPNPNAVNKPGVIYRVDPATGKSSVFFDLNTVISQTDPKSTTGAGNDANSVATGLKNWYSISFDPEGYFDGRPSMFVSSVDSTDPNKNVVYRIAPDGSFLGAFTTFNDKNGGSKFIISPTAILVPPVEQQSFLRGLIVGDGGSLTNQTTFNALFFDSNQFTPGQNISTTNLPKGVNELQMGGPQIVPVQVTTTTAAGGLQISILNQTIFTGPEVGLTAANTDYASPVYAVFTDFGTPSQGGIPARPGYSGVQGLNGESLLRPANFSAGTVAGGTLLTSPPPTGTGSGIIDAQSVATTPFRRFQSIAFDHYGYFSQGLDLSTINGGGNTGAANSNQLAVVPSYSGSVFVSDLASGDQVTVTPVTPLATTAIAVPIQGDGTVGAQLANPGSLSTAAVPLLNTTGIGEHLGRIIQITPSGQVHVFAEGFNVSSAQDATSFQSTLSISFSADGTTLYAADDDGIWQFKTVTSLANASSGSLLGLNDLRTLGVPYEGQNSAVAVVDTGVDGTVPSFRGRVANGNNVITNGFGNKDTAPASGATITGANANGQTNTTSALPTGPGHGTEIAGVVAQFVPQATIVPVNVFNPFQAGATGTAATGGAGGAGGAAATNGATLAGTTNAITTSQNVYKGLSYVASHPFANDPIRPGKTDRVIAATFGFGTNETFPTEVAAFKRYPQVVIALKNKLSQIRKLGITPIAAAGQFGKPFAAGVSTNGATATAANTATTGAVQGATNNAQNTSVGDVNGMSLPAVLNEVVSVTGSYPFPFQNGPDALPIDPPIGVTQQNRIPILVGGNNNQPGGGGTAGGGAGNANASGAGILSNLGTLSNGEIVNGIQTIYSDQIAGAVNRSFTTDFAAPFMDVPTFQRSNPSFSVTINLENNPNEIESTAEDANEVENQTVGFAAQQHMTFQAGGTSLSAAQVTGAFAVVSSALNYWTVLNKSGGVTSDAYLNMPVGTRTLNFGPHAFRDLSAWNTPDGINAILAWTAVPATDANSGLSQAAPPNLFGSTNFPQVARIDVGNAIAAIEGYEALNYLIDHNVFPTIDTNKDGLISTVELQSFVDNANQMGMPEAGAMARLLGGNARIPTTGAQNTSANENPDQPDVLQRRFNFFDYAADGQLNGSVSITQFKMLARTLLPNPAGFRIIDRQRASANGWLLDPSAHRNFQQLQHLLPKNEFIPKAIIRKYKNISPAQFHVDRGAVPGTTLPAYSLWSVPPSSQVVQSAAKTVGVAVTTATPTPTTTAASTTGTTTTTTNPPATPAPAGSLTPTTTTSTTSATPSPTTTTPTTTPTPASSSSPSSTTDVVQAVINAINGANTTPAGTTTTTTTLPPQPIVTPVVTTSTASTTSTTKKNSGVTG